MDFSGVSRNTREVETNRPGASREPLRTENNYNDKRFFFKQLFVSSKQLTFNIFVITRAILIKYFFFNCRMIFYFNHRNCTLTFSGKPNDFRTINRMQLFITLFYNLKILIIFTSVFCTQARE